MRQQFCRLGDASQYLARKLGRDVTFSEVVDSVLDGFLTVSIRFASGFLIEADSRDRHPTGAEPCPAGVYDLAVTANIREWLLAQSEGMPEKPLLGRFLINERGLGSNGAYSVVALNDNLKPMPVESLPSNAVMCIEYSNLDSFAAAQLECAVCLPQDTATAPQCIAKVAPEAPEDAKAEGRSNVADESQAVADNCDVSGKGASAEIADDACASNDKPESEPKPSESPVVKGLSKKAILSFDWPLTRPLSPKGEDRLKAALGDVKRLTWLQPALVGRPGAAGKESHQWNPALLARCLINQKWIVNKSKVQQLMESFPDYLSQWDEIKEMDKLIP